MNSDLHRHQLEETSKTGDENKRTVIQKRLHKNEREGFIGKQLVNKEITINLI